MTSTAVSPGTKSSADWIAVEQATFMPNRRPPMVIERGQGSRVWDVEGREYLDMIAGIAVVSLGHSSPVVTTRPPARHPNVPGRSPARGMTTCSPSAHANG